MYAWLEKQKFAQMCPQDKCFYLNAVQARPKIHHLPLLYVLHCVEKPDVWVSQHDSLIFGMSIFIFLEASGHQLFFFVSSLVGVRPFYFRLGMVSS